MCKWLLVAGILGGWIPADALIAQVQGSAPPSGQDTSQNAAGQAASQKTAAGQAASQKTAAGQAASQKTAADQAASQETAVANSASAPSFAETVVVTTTLKPEDARESTATVSVITADEIAARQSTDVAGLVATVPGVSIARSGSPGHVTSSFIRGTESNQTLVLWNGIPLNDPIFGGFDWAFLPTEGVQRIEVVRGPFSALYGSSAIGGVVQVLTAAAPGTDLRLEGGSDGYGQGRVAAGYDLGGVRLDVSGHFSHDDGQLKNDFYTSEEGVARAEWSLAPNTQLGLLVRANDSGTGIPFSGVEERLHRTQSWQERQVAVPFKTIQGPWQVEALVSESITGLRFRDPDDPFFSSSDSQTHELRGRAVASYTVNPETWLAAGGEWQRQQGSSASNLGVSLDHNSLRSEALFGQLRSAWGPARLDAGLRGDDYQLFGRRLSPHAALAWLFGPAARLHVSYGEGFRAPHLGELFDPFIGNPRLRPELSRSAEAGLDVNVRPWSFAVVGFENRLHDLIEYDFATNQEFNVGRARSRGVEAELGRKTAHFELRANGTYLDATNLDTGLALLRRPRKSGNLIATWRPGEQRWIFNLVERYVGRRADIDPATFAQVQNPGYERLDLAMQWRPSPTLAPYFRVQNLAGRRYSEVLGFPAPRRQLIGGVAMHF
jgi:vitamin B12 transporter